MTRRRWIADQWDETSAVLRDTQAAHLARVLRAQAGQEFDIVAGNTVRRGVIESVRENAVEFSLHEEVAAMAPLPLVIALSIIRFERMEWAIEKLTELGVAQIVPLAAQRSEKHLAQAAAKRIERWRKIARESAQQSRRADVPEIAEPIPLAQWLAGKRDGVRLLLSEHEHARMLRESLEISSALPSKEYLCRDWSRRGLDGIGTRRFCQGWLAIGQSRPAHSARGNCGDCNGQRADRMPGAINGLDIA